MASRNSRNKRGLSRSQKIFYVLSFLIIVSLVLSLVAAMITPTGGAGF